MTRMFNRCYSLEKLNLSNFNVDNVISMYNMFAECSLLKELIFPINIDKEFDARGMFYKCTSLKKYFSNFDIKNILHKNILFEEYPQY